MLQIVTAIFGGLVLCLALGVLMNKRSKRGTQPVPLAPNEHWLFGHIPAVAKFVAGGQSYDEFLFENSKVCGKIFEVNLLFVKMVVVSDPDAVKEVVVTKNYPKSPTYGPLKAFIGHKSMIIAHHDVWRKQRNAFNPGFNFQFIKDLVPVFSDKTDLLMKKLDKAAESGTVVKLHHEMTLLTMDIITRVVMSEDLGYQTDSQPPQLFTDFTDLFNICVYFYTKAPHLVWTRNLPWNAYRINKIQRRFENQLKLFVDKRITEMKQRTVESVKTHKDILTLAIDTAQASEDGALDMDDILSQLKSFLFAGHDTTATLMVFAVYELTRNPEIERLMVEEIRREWGGASSGKALDSDILGRLKYTTAVVKEALRLWPPASTARMAPLGTTLQGYDIGRKVLYIPHFLLHHYKDLWGPDAEEFRPERWLDEDQMSQLHPMSYQPFAKGPRDCIGQVLAMLEAKTVLAKLYDRYTFKYAGEKPEGRKENITFHPKYGMPVTVHVRTD